MSENTEQPDGDSATGPDPSTPRRGGNGLAGIAAFVAIIALLLAGWSVWQLRHARLAAHAMRQQDAAEIAALQNRLAAHDRQARTSEHRLGELESGMDDLRATTQGLDRRIANLETAFANLSGQQQSGHDTLLLDDAEMLLRAAQQRYELFHDTSDALKAYSQAIAVLAQVQNPVYAPVRTSAATERDALAAAAPPSRQAALNTLSALRGEVASLPLATPADTTTPTTKPGFWSRIGHALGGIVKITREGGTTTPLVDARFARQELALDLAQAQEALLAFDTTTCQRALRRADATLAAQFDIRNGAVKDARAQLAGLLAEPTGGQPPQLGGALAQLLSLRASQTPPVDLPAPASSGGAKP
jgi:uroporphyrin-III C-methyltransferase